MASAACRLGSQFWLDVKKGREVVMEIVNDQPDGMKMYLHSRCRNLSRSV